MFKTIRKHTDEVNIGRMAKILNFTAHSYGLLDRTRLWHCFISVSGRQHQINVYAIVEYVAYFILYNIPVYSNTFLTFLLDMNV